MRSPTVTKRSIYPNRHNTSVTLEDAFWESLKDIAHRRCISVSDLIGEIDAKPGRATLPQRCGCTFSGSIAATFPMMQTARVFGERNRRSFAPLSVGVRA